MDDTEVVKSALLSVIEKTPSKASRSVKLREWSRVILDKGSKRAELEV